MYANFVKTMFFSLCLLLYANLSHAVELSQQRLQFQEAYDALKSNDLDSFFTLSQGLQNYPLYHFLRYHYLKPRLTKVDVREVEHFLANYGDSGVGALLRKKWLYHLAAQEDWLNYIRWYTPQKKTDLQCHYATAKMRTGQQRQSTLHDIKDLWLVAKSQPKACDAAFEYLYNSRLMTNDLLWQRIHLTMDKGQTRLAQAIAKRLPEDQAAWVDYWRKMHSRPIKYLDEYDLPDVKVARDIIIDGIKQVARKNVDKAQTYWDIYQKKYAFSVEQIGKTQKIIALASLKKDHPDALKLLASLNKFYVDDELNEKRILFALEKQDWHAVADFITEFPEEILAEELRWQYWHARALSQIGKHKSAKKVYKQLAQKRDYYGFLAAEQIGQSYRLQHKSIAPSKKELKKLLRNINIMRAYEFYQLNMETDARRAWEYTIKHLSQRDKAVAATLATRWRWYDRGIFTASKAKAYDDLDVRFPLAYKADLKQGANTQGLDLAWVYGIIRQESAFMHQVRSHAGAMGLMQIMPATGRYVARKIGLPLRRTKDIVEIDNNIALGTAYLRQMLDKFDGNYMLATAAYNAGPGRAVRWSEERGCLPPDIWVELIPFSETQTYVKRVLFYTRIFEERLGQRPQALRINLQGVNDACPFSQANRYVNKAKDNNGLVMSSM